MSTSTSTNGSTAAVEQTAAEKAAAVKAAAKKLAAEKAAAKKAAAAEKLAAEKLAAEKAAAESTIDLAALIAAEDIEKAQRVYIDVPGVPRVPTAEGTLSAVQREQRADGTLGEFMLCEIRKSKSKGQPDSVQRASIARLQGLKTALESRGVKVFQ